MRKKKWQYSRQRNLKSPTKGQEVKQFTIQTQSTRTQLSKLKTNSKWEIPHAKSSPALRFMDEAGGSIMEFTGGIK